MPLPNPRLCERLLPKADQTVLLELHPCGPQGRNYHPMMTKTSCYNLQVEYFSFNELSETGSNREMEVDGVVFKFDIKQCKRFFVYPLCILQEIREHIDPKAQSFS